MSPHDVETIYLNNAATSFPKPPSVRQAVSDALAHAVGDPGRGLGRGMSKSAVIVAEARKAVAELFGVQDASRVVFTKNGTEALNTAIKGLVGPGRHVVTTSVEHNSVNRPLRHLEHRGLEVTWVPPTASGTVDPVDIDRAVRPNTALIVVVHVSNVLGNANPIREIGLIARRHGVAFLVDAAQSAGRLAIDVEQDHIDLLACPGHKGLLGPQGTGVLYVRPGIEIGTLTEGGTGTQSELETQPESFPNHLEAGSLNVPGIAGLGAGARFLLEQGWEKIRRQEERRLALLLDGLRDCPGLTVHGDGVLSRVAPIVSVGCEGMSVPHLAEACDTRGVVARPGLHCNPGAHRFLGTFPDGSLRLSASILTKEAEIERAVALLRGLAKAGRGKRRPADVQVTSNK